MAWNKPIWSNVDKLSKDIDDYFKHCEDSKSIRELKNGDLRIRQESPTMVGLANWLDVDKSTIYYYLNGERGKEVHSEETYNAIVATLSRAKQRIEKGLIQRSLDGDCDPRIGGMLLTSFGYNDGEKQPTAVTVTIAGLPDQAKEWSK